MLLLLVFPPYPPSGGSHQPIVVFWASFSVVSIGEEFASVSFPAVAVVLLVSVVMSGRSVMVIFGAVTVVISVVFEATSVEPVLFTLDAGVVTVVLC